MRDRSKIAALDDVALRVAMATRRIRHLGELAALAKISHVYARSIARGLVPSAEVQAKIAAALGVKPETVWKPVK